MAGSEAERLPAPGVTVRTEKLAGPPARTSSSSEAEKVFVACVNLTAIPTAAVLDTGVTVKLRVQMFETQDALSTRTGVGKELPT